MVTCCKLKGARVLFSLLAWNNVAIYLVKGNIFFKLLLKRITEDAKFLVEGTKTRYTKFVHASYFHRSRADNVPEQNNVCVLSSHLRD